MTPPRFNVRRIIGEKTLAPSGVQTPEPGPCPTGCGLDGLALRVPAASVGATTPRYQVTCRTCGMAGALFTDPAEAVRFWNTLAAGEVDPAEVSRELGVLDEDLIYAVDLTNLARRLLDLPRRWRP